VYRNGEGPIGRRKLIEIHARLGEIASRWELADVLSCLGDAAARLDEPAFRLIVLGAYKRGKSTLINALLGHAALPVGVVPLTSVATEVRHRPAPGAEIEFLDDRRETVPVETLPDYVSEAGNPRNQKGVRRAVLYDPAPILAAGVTIVDTPGVGSVFRHNTERTYEVLEETDAVVFVLAADQPLSAEESELLSALAGITARILFVVNRADVLSPEQLAQSVEFVRRSPQVSARDPAAAVLALSAREALEARTRGAPVPPAFEAFETRLRRDWVGRKSDILLDRARILTRRAAGLMALRLEAELHASRLHESELDRVAERFRSESDRIEARAAESVALFRYEVSRIHGAGLEQLADATRTRLRAELWPRVEASLAERKARPASEWLEPLADEIGASVVSRLRPHHADTERFVRERLDQALDRHATRMEEAARDLVATANGLLGMHAEVPPARAGLPERPRFHFTAWSYADRPLGRTRWWLRLPYGWIERRVVRLLRALLNRRIEQNLSAIQSDWKTRLEEALREFQRLSHAQLAATRDLVEDALVAARRMRVHRADDARATSLPRDADAAKTLVRGLADAPGSPGPPDPASPAPLAP
jgi:GTP-binding protein EngB required for normal cell division